MERLRQLLQQISGQGYKAYKRLQGCYDFGQFQLSIDHVQGDPFALPSRISIQINPHEHGIPPTLWKTRIRQTALEDFLARQINCSISQQVKGRRGTGRSGEISIACNQQQVLRRNAVVVDNDSIDARLLFALPGSGRSILADAAAEMFFAELPRIISDGLRWDNRSRTEMQRHVEQIEDQQSLREQLQATGAVAFVADGSVLARRSGIDDRPLKEALPTQSPPSLRGTLRRPNSGEISGMLIPRGVTLIVGGGFHGKSTLLQALERGIYNHIPSDGREFVVTTPNAVKIRAEDHRAITDVDISPFIGTLPGNRKTDCFSTENASGSTSQAANIIEALECRCDGLLIDEDTSATNFMIRDERMQQLVPAAQEPITPLLHRVRELYEKHGISTVIVTGGSGDYLSVADTVIMLDNYRLFDVTKKAHHLAAAPILAAAHPAFLTYKKRRINLQTGPLSGQREAKIIVREQRLLEYDRKRIDLSKVEQLLDAGQTEAIGRLLTYCHKKDPEQKDDLLRTVERALNQVEQEGLDLLLPWKAGHLALPRLHEVVAAANRLRSNRQT